MKGEICEGVEYVVWLYFLHCFSIQVSLATDFMYNYLSKEVTSSVGYDYILRQVSLPLF